MAYLAMGCHHGLVESLIRANRIIGGKILDWDGHFGGVLQKLRSLKDFWDAADCACDFSDAGWEMREELQNLEMEIEAD